MSYKVDPRVTDDVEIYVDPTGNDRNAGTASKPLLTFAAAWSRMVSGQGNRRIRLSAGTFDIASEIAGKDNVFSVPFALGPVGEAISIIGTQLDQLGELTVTDSTDAVVTADPHVGTFVGATLRFLSGAAVGQRFMIKADDGEAFTLLAAPSGVVPGDTFAVETPGTIFNCTGGGVEFSGGVLALKDVKFDMQGSGILVFREGCQVIAAQNVEVALNGAIFLVSGNAIFAPQSLGVTFNDPSPFSPSLGALCGLYLHDGDVRLNRGGCLRSVAGTPATAVLQNVDIAVGTGGAFDLNPVALLNVTRSDFTSQPAPGAEVNTVYVRSDGNDDTGDGTIENPFLTPERAAMVGWDPGTTLKIDMSNYGTYTPTVPWDLPTIPGATTLGLWSGPEFDAFGQYQRGDLEIYAEPTLQLTIENYGVDYTVAMDPVTRQVSVTVADAGWTVDEAAGMIISSSVLGGGRVLSNTTDTLVTTLVAFDAFDIGTLRVSQQSCTIDLSVAGWWFASDGLGRGNPFGLTLAGLNFTNAYFLFYGARFDALWAVGCDMPWGYTCGTTSTAVACRIVDGGFETNVISADTDEVANFWGCYIEDADIFSNGRGKLSVFGCEVVGGDSIGEGVYHGLYPDLIPAGAIGVECTTHRDTARGGVRLSGAARSGLVGFCRFDNCGYGGIRLEAGSRLTVNGPLAGTGNAYGIYALCGTLRMGSAAETTSETLDASTITLTGTGGDLKVGQNEARTWTGFFTGGPIGVEADDRNGGARVYQQNSTAAPLPRVGQVTTTERDALSLGMGDAGLMIFNSTDGVGQMWDGSAWQDLWV